MAIVSLDDLLDVYENIWINTDIKSNWMLDDFNRVDKLKVD